MFSYGFVEDCNMKMKGREGRNYRGSFTFAVLLLFNVFLCQKARIHSVSFYVLRSMRT